MEQIKMIGDLLNDAIDLVIFLVKVALILIAVILAFSFYQIGGINISNDQKNLNRYSALIQDQHSENVQNIKRQFIKTGCNGAENCSTSMGNVEFLDLYIDIKEIDNRIQKRNDSFKGWMWFGQEPIETH